MSTGWTDLIFEVAAKDAKAAEEIAAQCSSAGIYIENCSDFEEILPFIGRADYIDNKLIDKCGTNTVIHIYVAPEENPDYTFLRIFELLRLANIKFAAKRENIDETDWENDWKRFHKPEKIGSRLVVCPSWEKYDLSGDDVVLIMDPGSSFGSGKDETTKVCLRLIEKHLSCGDTVLDIGCGSGILSVAALLLGAKFAVGVDIDRNAVDTACENALINGVGSRFKGLHGNMLEDIEFKNSLGCGYDLICANIAADLHILMKELFSEKIKPRGKLLLSGIIQGRADEVRFAFERLGFVFTDCDEENGWVAFAFQKP